MYFLDGDYDDNLIHFFAADERFLINLMNVEKKIRKLKLRHELSRLYHFDKYLEIN